MQTRSLQAWPVSACQADYRQGECTPKYADSTCTENVQNYKYVNFHIAAVGGSVSVVVVLSSLASLEVLLPLQPQ